MSAMIGNFDENCCSCDNGCCQQHGSRLGPLNDSITYSGSGIPSAGSITDAVGCPSSPSHSRVLSSHPRDFFKCLAPTSIRLSSQCQRERKKKLRCTYRQTSMAPVVFAAAFVLAFISSCMAFSPSSTISISTSQRTSLTQLHSSVRKRSGKHDLSAARAKVPIAAKSPATSLDHKIEQHQLQRKQSLIEIQMIREQQKKRRSKNVFEQFTPEYVKNPFDVDVISQNSEAEANSSAVNGKSKQQQKHLTQRLKSLLQNDEGEQDYFADDSPEAAEQIADIKIYGKLSEEARRKATEAVKEVKHKTQNMKDGDNEEGVVQSDLPVQKKRKSKVRATVKETGSDSINTYIKSLGQHELLNKADEVLLATQVRLLIRLEETRKMLESEQLR